MALPRSLTWDTQLRQSVSTLGIGFSNYKNRNIQGVAYRVDGVAEDQVFDATVSVRAHHQQIGLDFARVTDDLPAWIGAVADGGFDIDLHLAEGFHEAVEIPAARFHFGGRGFLAKDLAGDW